MSIAMAANTEQGSVRLQEIAVVYMLDVRRDWEDFRKVVKEASVIWGLKDWIFTLLLGGKIWNTMRAEGLLEGFDELQKKG